MEHIRNIYCVGRNYRLHAEELGNAVPDSPFLFLKPTHALVQAEGQEITLPGENGEVHHELELVIHIAEPFRPGMRADDVVDKMALGIDFTLRDVQSELKKKGYPWLLAKGFLHSAVVTKFFAFPGMDACRAIDFTLRKNGVCVQRGNIREMVFDVQTLLEFTARHFGLGPGDLIFTGTPAGVGAVTNGDHLAMLWGEQTWGEFRVKM